METCKKEKTEVIERNIVELMEKKGFKRQRDYVLVLPINEKSTNFRIRPKTAISFSRIKEIIRDHFKSPVFLEKPSLGFMEINFKNEYQD